MWVQLRPRDRRFFGQLSPGELNLHHEEMKLAVAGGSGTVGRYVVEAAEAQGHQAVVLSRRAGVDLTTGDGLAAALGGVDVVVDCANITSMSGRRATTFFTQVSRQLQAAAAAGASHLVTLSILGVDRVPLGYYRAKLEHERTAAAGPLPATIVRATQFHEFPAQLLQRSRLGPVAFVPRLRSQPVAARSVGQFLVEAAVAGPADQRLAVAGPQPEDMVDLARRLTAARHRSYTVVPLRLPGRTLGAMRTGAILPAPQDHATVMGPTFAEWLDTADAAAVPI